MSARVDRVGFVLIGASLPSNVCCETSPFSASEPGVGETCPALPSGAGGKAACPSGVDEPAVRLVWASGTEPGVSAGSVVDVGEPFAGLASALGSETGELTVSGLGVGKACPVFPSESWLTRFFSTIWITSLCLTHRLIRQGMNDAWDLGPPSPVPHRR